MRVKYSGQRAINPVTKATRQAKAAELFHGLFKTVTMRRGRHVIRVVGTSESLPRVLEMHVGMGYKVLT